MSALNHALERLRALTEPVSNPGQRATLSDIESIQQKTARRFPSHLIHFLLETGDLSFGAIEPITVMDPTAHTHFTEVLVNFRAINGPETLIPICEDNGNFYCIQRDGTVVFWDHNGPVDESWPDMANWITDVWIASD
ncbi:MAG: SMI1/KNR4 family protein [Pseudomonadota bacterium]